MRQFALVGLFVTAASLRPGQAAFVGLSSASSLSSASMSSASRPCPSGARSRSRSTSRSGTGTSTSTARFVFERMSEDCIGAIVTSQKEALSANQMQVELPFLVAGIVDMPETPAMERTLKQYGITWRKVKRVLEDLYPQSQQQSQKSLGSFFQARDPSDDLPFGKDLQQALKRAAGVADQMQSTQIQSHHLFLGMLEYSLEGTSKVKAQPASAVTDPSLNGAWNVLTQLEGRDAKITALDICQSLWNHLQERDLVTGIGGPGSSAASATKTLDQCGVDLTQQAMDGLLDITQGRDKEIQSCIRTLVRRRKNNVVLIGEPGVGKTCIAEGIAQLIVSPQCPTRLKGYRVMSLELATLVAGTKYRGEFEERLQAIVQEVTSPKAPPTILFIDEIHNLVGAGAAEGGMDAANLLKPALARGQLQVIGATTISEYRKHIEKDAALERRLQPVMVKEPSVAETIDILQAIAPSYELHHGVKYTQASFVAAAKMSERYLTDRFLPDKVSSTVMQCGSGGNGSGSGGSCGC